MRPNHRAEQIISIQRVRDPVAQRLIDRSAQRAIATLDRHDACSEQPHTPHVGRLTLHVDGTHVHGARQPETRARRSGCDPVLPGASLGDDASGSQASRKQRLADGVVDFVRAGVRQIFPLQPDIDAPDRRKTGGKGERGRPAHPPGELGAEFRLQVPRVEVLTHSALEPLECRNECLRHIAAAERTETATVIGKAAGHCSGEQLCGLDLSGCGGHVNSPMR